MPLRVEAVDVQHSNQVALLRGPLVRFAVQGSQPAFEKADLMRARATSSAGDWAATAADGTDVVMRPFMNIQEEPCITYVKVKS